MYQESEFIQEIRKLREENAEKYPTHEEYMAYILGEQEKYKAEGFKFVDLSKKKKEESKSQ